MTIQVSPADAVITDIEAEALVVGVYGDGTLTSEAMQIDDASGRLLTRLLEAEEISGQAGKVTALLTVPGIRAGQVVVVGLGDREGFDCGQAFRAAAAAAKKLAEKKRTRVAFYLGSDWTERQVESGVCGSLCGCRGQDMYRSEKNLHAFDEVLWDDTYEAVLLSGQVLGESVNLVRQLVNEPASRIYPESFAAEAYKFAEEFGLQIDVWDETQLEEQRCGALLAVARGSQRAPRLVMLQHRGGPEDAPSMALVGKGVTFDSGGLSLKPSDAMQAMKCDMAGAATVLGAMTAIARLELPVNVIGLMGLVENMVSGDAYKLGDVVTSRQGKTIEVLNTDAEGRLVLADLLDIAVERGVDRIIDLATLTGACMVALGTDVAGLMTNDPAWCDEVRAAADACGEPAWPLPMFPEFGEQIRSKVADIKNIGEGRWGGAITAAKFLEEFVGETPWVHIDIAGPAFLENAKSWLDAGGSGAFVRTLVEVVQRSVTQEDVE
jgi:leucyl aminopeptidase